MHYSNFFDHLLSADNPGSNPADRHPQPRDSTHFGPGLQARILPDHATVTIWPVVAIIGNIQAASGKRQAASGKRQTASGKRQAASGKRQTASGKRGARIGCVAEGKVVTCRDTSFFKQGLNASLMKSAIIMQGLNPL